MDSEGHVELDPETTADPLDDDGAAAPGASFDASATPEPEISGTDLAPSKGGPLAPFDPFRRYMAEARKYPPLSREDEQELARRYRETGDREALFRLITSNLLLVVRIALSFRRAAKNLLDLIQEGNIGLLQAIDRFDPDVGVRLPTYAAYWVRAYMVKFLLDNVRMVRVGTTNARRKLLRNLRKEKARLESQGFEVDTKLLAEHFGVSQNDVTEVQQALESRDTSIDAPVGEGDRPAADLLSDPGGVDIEADYERAELQQRVEAALELFRPKLGERDELLLDGRILSDEPLSLQEIGDRFGTSREAVRQAEVRLMKRLREHLLSELGDVGEIQLGPR